MWRLKRVVWTATVTGYFSQVFSSRETLTPERWAGCSFRPVPEGRYHRSGRPQGLSSLQSLLPEAAGRVSWEHLGRAPCTLAVISRCFQGPPPRPWLMWTGRKQLCLPTGAASSARSFLAKLQTFLLQPLSREPNSASALWNTARVPFTKGWVQESDL